VSFGFLSLLQVMTQLKVTDKVGRGLVQNAVMSNAWVYVKRSRDGGYAPQMV